MNIQQWKARVKRISTEKDSEIHKLTEELNISLDSEALQNIISLGTKSLNYEWQLKKTIKELEEKKQKLECEFKKIASQRIALESKCVGMQNQIVKIYRDNRIFAMHLCAKTSRTEHERLLREKFIQKYIMDSKLT